MHAHEDLPLMFGEISPTYRLLNSLLSFGIDRIWRKKLVSAMPRNLQSIVIDVSTGTADIPVILHKMQYSRITGVAPSEKMLTIAKKRIEKLNSPNNIELICAGAENIPIAGNSADVVTVAFGVRNFDNLQQGFNEVFRILKNNSHFLILEFSLPQNTVLRILYKAYLYVVLQFFGGIISGNFAAYRYLRKSIIRFTENCDLVKELEGTGFTNIAKQNLTGGIVSIYTAEKQSD